MMDCVPANRKHLFANVRSLRSLKGVAEISQWEILIAMPDFEGGTNLASRKDVRKRVNMPHRQYLCLIG